MDAWLGGGGERDDGVRTVVGLSIGGAGAGLAEGLLVVGDEMLRRKGAAVGGGGQRLEWEGVGKHQRWFQAETLKTPGVIVGAWEWGRG